MIEAGSAIIKDNTIKDNYDGIIMITSSPEVFSNKIETNKNSGMMIMKDSRPKIYSNELISNNNVGLFVRDNSRFERAGNEKEGIPPKFYFYDNVVDGTDVALVVERKISDGKQIVEKNPELRGECRIPYTFREMRCALI